MKIMFRFAVIFKLLFNDFWIITERAYGDIGFCVIHLSGVGGGKKYAWASDFPGKFLYTFGGEFHHVAELSERAQPIMTSKVKQNKKRKTLVEARQRHGNGHQLQNMT